MIITARSARAALHEKEIDIPIKYNSVDEPSQITYLRLKEVLVAVAQEHRLGRGSSGTRRPRAIPSRFRSRPRTWQPQARSGVTSGAGSSRSCW